MRNRFGDFIVATTIVFVVCCLVNAQQPAPVYYQNSQYAVAPQLRYESPSSTYGVTQQLAPRFHQQQQYVATANQLAQPVPIYQPQPAMYMIAVEPPVAVYPPSYAVVAPQQLSTAVSTQPYQQHTPQTYYPSNYPAQQQQTANYRVQQQWSAYNYQQQQQQQRYSPAQSYQQQPQQYQQQQPQQYQQQQPQSNNNYYQQAPPRQQQQQQRQQPNRHHNQHQRVILPPPPAWANEMPRIPTGADLPPRSQQTRLPPPPAPPPRKIGNTVPAATQQTLPPISENAETPQPPPPPQAQPVPPSLPPRFVEPAPRPASQWPSAPVPPQPQPQQPTQWQPQPAPAQPPPQQFVRPAPPPPQPASQWRPPQQPQIVQQPAFQPAPPQPLPPRQPLPLPPRQPLPAPAPPPLPPPPSVAIAKPQVDPAKPIKRPANPNEVFLACCKSKRVDAQCESRCNFDVLNRKVLTAMFLGTDQCPISNGRDLLACAAQDSDLTACCRSKGVAQTSAGDKCLGFCQMAPGSEFQADSTMLPCWAVLETIKLCFKEHIIATNAF